MNQPKRSMAETLALYHEHRLPADEQNEVEAKLRTDPQWQQCSNELGTLENSLHDWGAYRRSKSNVIGAICHNVKVRPSTETVTALPGTQTRWVPSLAMAASILVVFLAAVMWFSSPSLQMQVMVSNGQALLSAGDRVSDTEWKTGNVQTGEDGYIKILMGDQVSTVAFAGNSQAEITGPRSIALNQGTLYTEVGKKDGKAYTVSTPHGVVDVLGTTFEVVVTSKKTTVRLVEGSVKANSRLDDSKFIYLKPGEEVTIMVDSIGDKKAVPVNTIATWTQVYQGNPHRGVANTLHEPQN